MSNRYVNLCDKMKIKEERDMKKLYSEQYIGRLIDRFMAGETTLDEERKLGEYFRTARRVPAEWDT